VEDKRLSLAEIVRAKGIIPRGENSFYQSGMDEDQGARNSLEVYYQLEREKSQLESQIDSLMKYDSIQLMSFASGLDLPDNVIKVLYPEYLKAQRELDSYRIQGLGDRHPTVLAAIDQIQKLKKQLDEGVVTLRETLRAKLDMATNSLKSVEVIKDDTRDEAIARSLDTQDYVEIKREFDNEQAMLQTMKMSEMGKIIEGKMTEESIIVHDEPKIARTPASPNVPLNLALGAVVGLIFGVGIAFFLEYLDTSVKSLEDVERYLQVPVLAVIPKDVGVLHKQSGMSPDAEAYRILRTNIEFNRKNPEDNAITVVSGGAGEGKSTTLVNLAYICAQGGYTTLMIDADLRRPRLHTFFDINNSV
ncbi:MAG: hypothetical protein EOP83_35425, partial [Verrucomicrobiaceae bacterium]